MNNPVLRDSHTLPSAQYTHTPQLKHMLPQYCSRVCRCVTLPVCWVWRRTGGVKVQLHPLSTSVNLAVGAGEWSTSRPDRSAHWIGNWLGLKTGDDLEKRKTSCPCWESNADHPTQSLQYTLNWDPGPQCSVCCALLTVYLMSPFVAHMITEERVGKNLQRNTPDVIRNIIPKFFLNKLRKIMKMLLRIASTQAEIWTRVWHRRMMALVF